MEADTYYKIVFCAEDGDMISATFVGGDSGVEYELGWWARPREGCGPLCVFDSLEGALDFYKEYLSRYVEPNDYRCFQCSIEPSEHKRVWLADSECLHAFDAVPMNQLPANTVLADAVRLEKLVFDW